MIGVACLVVHDDQVLLIRRQRSHGAGTWSTPGGHLDFGESPIECAARETLEETGVTVSNVRFLAITDDRFEADRKHYITLWMRADYAGGTPAVADEHEVAEVVWSPLTSLPEPLFLSLENLFAGQSYPAPANSAGVADWITGS